MRYLNFIEIDDNVGLQLASAALLGLALLPILVGSFSSLQLMATTSDTPRRRSSRHHQEEETTEEKAIVITTKDAFLFPLIGSAFTLQSLLAFDRSLYRCCESNHSSGRCSFVVCCICQYTFIGFSSIVYLQNILVGLTSTSLASVKRIQVSPTFHRKNHRINKKITRTNRGVSNSFYRDSSCLPWSTSWILAIFYASTESWIVGNMFSIALAVDCIGSLTVDSFLTGFSLVIWHVNL